jgi:hypothetical protein
MWNGSSEVPRKVSEGCSGLQVGCTWAERPVSPECRSLFIWEKPGSLLLLTSYVFHPCTHGLEALRGPWNASHPAVVPFVSRITWTAFPVPVPEALSHEVWGGLRHYKESHSHNSSDGL